MPEVLKVPLIKRGAKPTGLYAAGWWDDTHILKLLISSLPLYKARR